MTDHPATRAIGPTAPDEVGAPVPPQRRSRTWAAHRALRRLGLATVATAALLLGLVVGLGHAPGWLAVSLVIAAPGLVVVLVARTLAEVLAVRDTVTTRTRPPHAVSDDPTGLHRSGPRGRRAVPGHGAFGGHRVWRATRRAWTLRDAIAPLRRLPRYANPATIIVSVTSILLAPLATALGLVVAIGLVIAA